MTGFPEASDPLSLRHVIIGSGEAGTRAALALRDAGARHITLIGAEAELPYERPPLSKPDSEGVTIRRIAEGFDGISTRFGIGVTAIDRALREVEMEDGQRLSYDRLLFATGARPRPFASGIRALRSRADAEAIFAAAKPGATAVIIGAGLIGLELAAELRRRGLSVTVLELAPRALGRALPARIAEEIVVRHRLEGVDLRLGAVIAEAEAKGVTLGDGTRLEADLVVAAIGVIPETALAEEAGLACGNGIHVDAGLATEDPAIFAAGDCAATDHPHLGRMRFETWRNSCDQGVMAARAMLGEAVRFTASPWFWSDQYDLGIQMVGLHDPARETVQRDLPGGGFLLFELSSDGTLAAASGIAPGMAVAKEIRLAEMLIDRRARPLPAALRDPVVGLKSLLRG